MAMRRPRIKPLANIHLNSRRKPKSANDVKTVKAGESDINKEQEVEKEANVLTSENSVIEQPEQVSNNNENGLEVRVDTTVDTTANEDNKNNGINLNENYRSEEDQIQQNVEEINCNTNNETNENNTKETETVINNTEKEHLKTPNEVVTDALNDSDPFKCPSKVGLQRAISHTSNSGVDDVFYSDIEENALQMDIEKSPSHGSPKNLSRQRIRPTPHFRQRRNSFVSSSPSPHTSGNDDNHVANNEFSQPTTTRRERHHSASFTGGSNSTSSSHHFHHSPHKYLPNGITNSCMGRIRTESGCSVFSDTNTSCHKPRKTEDSKQNSRKDFEARFYNGVPEKSAIKMSDLIYYNPATNPMEQKQNPNVSEQPETTSSDVKPFSEKVENCADTPADDEAAPVPQLKLNANGELIIDDKSLVIETSAEEQARKILANSSLIYLNENTGMNGYYSRQKRTREWMPSETIKFYRCLQNIGTDFSLMVSLFPDRTRRDLKLKFKKEERKNCHLINKALLYPKQFDLEALKEQLEEEEKLREEQAKISKMNKEKLKETKKKRIQTSSRTNRILLNEDIYQNENDQQPKKVRKSSKKKDAEIYESVGEQCEKNDQQTTNCDEVGTNEDVNHNNDIGPKRKKRKTESKKQKEEQITPNNTNNNNIEEVQIDQNVKVDKIKRRRRTNKAQKEEIIIIKEEIIKVESKQDSNSALGPGALTEYQDTKQLQTEIDDLLDSDAVDIQYGNHNSLYETTAANVFPGTSQMTQYNEHVSATPSPVSYTTHYTTESYVENNTDINKYEHRTFVNLDDGSVNVYSKIEDDSIYMTSSSITTIPSPTRSQSPPIPASPPLHPSPEQESPINNESITFIEADENIPTTITTASISEPEIINNDTCSMISERELNEEDIQKILTELADGSLVLVSTLDPDDPDKVLNEIYMVDKNTGELGEEPLNIPENIVQCILTVVS